MALVRESAVASSWRGDEYCSGRLYGSSERAGMREMSMAISEDGKHMACHVLFDH